MAIQLKNSRSKFKVATTTGVVIIGSYIILKTFPHLKDSLYNYLTGTKKIDENNEPIELKESGETEEQDPSKNSGVDESNFETGVEVTKWSDNRLKDWLKGVSIQFPVLINPLTNIVW